jgi:putative beta-lysine N-acetyltransferase
MYDKIETLPSGSIIQHGPFNDRIYLLKATNNNLYNLPERLKAIAKNKGYGKIFAKLNEVKSLPFLSQGFIVEARVPSMYPRDREGIFLAAYPDKDRKVEDDKDLYEKNLRLALEKQKDRPARLDTKTFKIRPCTKKDIPQMTAVYKEVFKTYPFPIHDNSYIEKTMSENVDYFCVEHDGRIIALSSAEKDPENLYAEMTDFATLPDWRGHGLALHLLRKMERSIKEQGYQTAFTIARSASAGMNITFARAGYEYGGRLKNNTNIAGHIESMNIWHKALN